MDWPALKTHAFHLAISLVAVAAMAILQHLIVLLSAYQPDLLAGASQTAAAFSGIKLLGR